MPTVRNDIKEDDETLFREYRENPTRENRNKIVSKYLYLPEIISKKFLNRGLDYEDIYQVGCIALIKAVERFDPGKGVKFVSFATPTILGEIKRYFRDKVSMIRIPRRIYEIYQKVNHAREQLTFKLQRPPKVNEIAEFLNLSEEAVLEITEAWGLYNMQSFDQEVYDDSNVDFYGTIGKDDATFEKIENRDFLEKSMDMFNDLEKEFIRMRYHDNKTQKAIADKMGVSQMYVSRMERKILQKFRRIINK
jgi:RNA polymerase sigma-B factor